MNLKLNKITIFFAILCSLFILNIINVFAGSLDDADTNSYTQMDNPRLTYKSEYSDGDGYEKVVFTMPTADGPVIYALHYYHYARVKITQDGTERTIPLWLYKWTNQVFDKEIEDELDRTREDGVSMLGFYDPKGETNAYVPDESLGATFMNYFMWPMSSEGRSFII